LADFLTIGTAISTARDAVSVLGSRGLGGSQRVGAVALDGTLSPGPFDDVRAVLNATQARAGLNIAVTAGNGVLGALKAILSSAKLAQQEPLVSPLTNLVINGTRVSRLNLDSDTNRALELIDRLIASTEIGNANFISSNSPNIVVKTSRFGGSIKITPQPLDRTGLNLAAISLLTQAGAEDAEARISSAINTTQRRLLGLQSLQRAVTSGDFTNASLNGLTATISGSGLPLGTLVNLVG